MLYGSTSGDAGTKHSAGLGGYSYEAGEYSYELSGDPADEGGGYRANGSVEDTAAVDFSGSRPLTACGE